MADAVVVGAGTLITDDPALTVRLDGYAGRQPVPVVVAGRRALPGEARVWEREAVVYAPGPCAVPAEVVAAPGDDGRVDLAAMLDDLGRREVADVLVEGGPSLVGAMLRAGLAQRGVAYFGAMLGAGVGRPAVGGEFAVLEQARKVEIVGATPVGPDVRVDFVVGGS
jgi:diaminohydroxyphosphoribosylaminopyrimidine deaminase/5-amino-6-(5-phosphoribosylamino)uracil reductase